MSLLTFMIHLFDIPLKVSFLLVELLLQACHDGSKMAIVPIDMIGHQVVARICLPNPNSKVSLFEWRHHTARLNFGQEHGLGSSRAAFRSLTSL